jgi:Rha family phage regulatory protein
LKNLVVIKRNRAVCDSLEVAERFHKKHKSVLRSIDNIVAQNCATKEMFHKAFYKAGDGQVHRKYFMNRDGFSLLAMGFTGSEAMKWKLDYINAFNAMEKLLHEQQTDEFKFFRKEGKPVRLAETEIIKQLAEYAKNRGSRGYKNLYTNYTNLANKTVGIKHIDEATIMQLNYLKLIENIFAQIILAGMAESKDHHDIYQDCKVKAIQLNNAVAIDVTA